MNKNLSNTSIGLGALPFHWALCGGETDSGIITTTEEQQQNICPFNTTVDSMIFFAQTNTLDEDTPITLRIEKAMSSITITVPANSGTVVLQDTTNRELILVTDFMVWRIDSTTSTAGAMGRIALGLRGVT